MRGVPCQAVEDRAPTMRNVAARAGVSTATVSCVLNRVDGVDFTAAERVRAACAALRYRPNHAARAVGDRRITCNSGTQRGHDPAAVPRTPATRGAEYPRLARRARRS